MLRIISKLLISLTLIRTTTEVSSIESFLEPSTVKNLIEKARITGCLNLSGSLTDGVIPEAVWTLENLKKLNISNCGLKKLPEDIGKLKNLTALMVNQNYLTTLPKEIGMLVNLKKLFINRNPIGCVPKVLLNMKNLEFVYWTSNPNPVIEEDPDYITLEEFKNSFNRSMVWERFGN